MLARKADKQKHLAAAVALGTINNREFLRRNRVLTILAHRPEMLLILTLLPLHVASSSGDTPLHVEKPESSVDDSRILLSGSINRGKAAVRKRSNSAE